MSNAKPQHTPGPWKWDKLQPDWLVSDERWILSVGGALPSREDARLIAAAPSMMSALREALLLAQETDHAESSRLRKLFTDVLIQAGDAALREVYERE